MPVIPGGISQGGTALAQRGTDPRSLREIELVSEKIALARLVTICVSILGAIVLAYIPLAQFTSMFRAAAGKRTDINIGLDLTVSIVASLALGGLATYKILAQRAELRAMRARLRELERALDDAREARGQKRLGGGR